MIDEFLRRPHGPAEWSADALRLLGLVSVIVAAIGFTWTDAGVLAFALPALLIPRFVGARPAFDIVYSVCVLIAAWSNVLDLYTSIWWWDIAVHFVATGVIAAMVFVLFGWWGVLPRSTDPSRRPQSARVLVPVIGLALSAVWEMVEWAGFTWISDQIYVTYDDTIGDMVVGGLGATIAGLIVARVRLERRRAGDADSPRKALSGDR
ncbi:hypothetical protein ABC304_12320 [Microbacterium sp. 1P10UB]|uniref:hypothetical protein n=1 Tax=unclassified Microbacterium TaxID=2609290 RepID=UPI0039A06AF4